MNDGPHFNPLKLQDYVRPSDDGCRGLLLFRNSQNPSGVLMSQLFEPLWSITMLRTAALRCTTDGRLLGFDTGDWSMLLGGFVLAGFLALMV
jgi:hypothetical protein